MRPMPCKQAEVASAVGLLNAGATSNADKKSGANGTAMAGRGVVAPAVVFGRRCVECGRGCYVCTYVLLCLLSCAYLMCAWRASQLLLLGINSGFCMCGCTAAVCMYMCMCC